MSKKEQHKKEEIDDTKSCKLPIIESIKKNDSMKLKDLLPKSLGMCEDCD